YLLRGQSPEEIIRRLAGCRIIHTGKRCDLFHHVFAELTALDQRGVGVLRKEALGKRAEAMQLRADLLQMTEIRRQCPTQMRVMTSAETCHRLSGWANQSCGKNSGPHRVTVGANS